MPATPPCSRSSVLCLSLAFLALGCGPTPDSGDQGAADDNGTADSPGDGDAAGDERGEGEGDDDAGGDGGEEGNDDGDEGDGDGDGDGDGEDGDGDGDDGGGVKFDLGELTDIPDQLSGSCRPSEVYGAAGGFPAFDDPAYAEFLDRSVAVVTHNNHGTGTVMTIVDISGDPPPPNQNYYAPLYTAPNWTKANLGANFGLTLDSDGNIYVSPTTVFGGNPDPGTIRRIDGMTGEISVFATLPNNGPALGNLNYDCVSETIYASSHEDGRIYQLAMDGSIVSTFHHATATVTVGAPDDPSEPDGAFVPLGDRVWAVQSHAGRLYYSVWWEDTGRKDDLRSNEIWSVAYADESGVPDPTTAKKEFDVPAYNNSNYSNPVADISFAATGWMLISQRTMTSDTSDSAHQSTTYEYDFDNGSWVLIGTTYVIGELPGSAAGGVDHDFEPGGYVWMTGDALDFYTPDVVYGLQGTPHGGGGIETSTLIDLDAEVNGQDKTVYGDVELPIPGDASPVPPPG